MTFFVPFFFAACCIGLALTCRSDAISRLYFFDLVGAGTGAVLAVGVLFVAFPQGALRVLVCMALAASCIVRPPHLRRPAPASGAMTAMQFACLLLVAGLAIRGGPALHVSEYKGLSQALEVVDSRMRAPVVEPARAPDRRREPDRAFSACAGPEFRHAACPARAARGVHRRGGHERDHALRRQSGLRRIPR